jgi:hydrogenase/urease accessory protein HupE
MRLAGKLSAVVLAYLSLAGTAWAHPAHTLSESLSLGPRHFFFSPDHFALYFGGFVWSVAAAIVAAKLIVRWLGRKEKERIAS